MKTPDLQNTYTILSLSYLYAFLPHSFTDLHLYILFCFSLNSPVPFSQSLSLPLLVIIIDRAHLTPLIKSHWSSAARQQYCGRASQEEPFRDQPICVCVFLRGTMNDTEKRTTNWQIKRVNIHASSNIAAFHESRLLLSTCFHPVTLLPDKDKCIWF